MTEEKYNEIKSLKEKIEKLERDIRTIEHLIESVNLGMEITGTSVCKFKVKRFMKLDGDDFIKSILDSERKNIEYKLSQLRGDFNNL
jgi:hypothetical protein